MENKKQTLLDKAYNLPYWKHYILCLIIFLVTLLTLLKWMLGAKAGVEHTEFAAIISVVFSAILTLMNYSAKQSDKFWKSLDDIEVRVKSSKTAEELEQLYLEIIGLHKKSGLNFGSSIARVITIINTRLRYEFKYEEIQKK